MSIKQKLITSFFVIALMSVLLVAILSYSSARDAVRNARMEGLKGVAELKAARLEGIIKDMQENISIVQEYHNVRTNLPIISEYANNRDHPSYLAAKQMLDGQLKAWMRVKNEVVNFMLVDTAGRVMYATHTSAILDSPLPDPGGKAFTQGKQGLYLSDVFRDSAAENNLVMLITAPIKDFDDGFIGMVALEIDVDMVFLYTQDATGMGETGETVIGRRVADEVVIINTLRHDPDSALNRRVTIGSKDAIPIQRAVLGESGQSISVDYRGEEIIAHWMYLPSLGWGLVAKIDTREAFAANVRLRNSIIVMGIGLLLLASIVAITVTRSIIRPIQLLQRGTIEVGDGNLDYRVELDSRDEIGELARAFNRMTQRLTDITASRDELDEEISERRRAEAELQQAHDQLEYQVAERTGNLKEANDALQRENIEHLRVEEALKKSEEQLRLISDTIEEVFWVSDWQTHRTLFASLAYEKVWQQSLQSLYENVSGWSDAIHPDDRDRAWQGFVNLADTQTYDEEYRIVLPDGSVRIIRDRRYPVRNNRGEVYCAVGIAQDITQAKVAEREKAELQTQLIQTQRMEAVGTLAGGIAHDFNNILAGVYGFAELARLQVPPESGALDSLAEILHAVDRAKNLTQQILTFSRNTEQNKIPLDLRSTIRDALKFLRPTLPATIKIQQKINVKSAWISADPTQMQQILINLSNNAAAAMHERGGVLELILDEMQVEEPAPASLSQGLSSGCYIKLTVRDTGTGISAKVLDRIFDPFFTTKEVGQGTGLGLAIVHAIVTDHHGLITVDSSPGEYTSFTILLPRIEAFETTRESVSATSQGGIERILYVDDEKTITRVNKRLLEDLGYRVVATNSSLDALGLFRSQPDAFDLLITDQTMAAMTGDQLCREVLALRADMPIILCTGFSDRIDEDSALALGIHSYLLKPVSINVLAATIRSIFDEERESA